MEVRNFNLNSDDDDDDEEEEEDEEETYEWESSRHQLRMEIASACLPASHVACFNPSHACGDHFHHHQRSPKESRNRRTKKTHKDFKIPKRTLENLKSLSNILMKIEN